MADEGNTFDEMNRIRTKASGMIGDIAKCKDAILSVTYELLQEYQNLGLAYSRAVFEQSQKDNMIITLGRSLEKYESRLKAAAQEDFDRFNDLKKLLGIEGKEVESAWTETARNTRS